MPMDEALVARLVAVPAISAIVDDRVSWFERPPADGTGAALNAIVLTEITPGRNWTHDGPTELDEPRIQFDCWAEKPSVALALARAVQTEMERLDVVTVDDWVFEPCASLELRRRDTERLGNGVNIHRVQLDFTIYHHPA